jgi:hypothetical protein
MPCSTTLGVTFAAVMVFPSIGLIAALIAATILAPTDAALGKAVVTNKRAPIHGREAIVNGIPIVRSLDEEPHGGVDDECGVHVLPRGFEATSPQCARARADQSIKRIGDRSGERTLVEPQQ